MKNLCYLLISILLFTACGSKDLDKATALKLLQEQKDYPKIIDYEIYTADPVDAKKIFEAGLEKDGFVKIAHTQKITDIGEPIITFTNKAKAYLLPQTAEDLKNKVQRVKVAEQVIDEIIEVKLTNNEKIANIKYNTSLIKITPFYNLNKKILKNKIHESTLEIK